MMKFFYPYNQNTEKSTTVIRHVYKLKLNIFKTCKFISNKANTCFL